MQKEDGQRTDAEVDRRYVSSMIGWRVFQSQILV